MTFLLMICSMVYHVLGSSNDFMARLPIRLIFNNYGECKSLLSREPGMPLPLLKLS